MPVRGPDTRIPLMAQTPERIDPFGTLGKVLAIRGMQRQEEQDARKLAKERQFEALAQQYGDDPEEFVKQIGRVDPEMGAKMSKLYAETRKEQFSAYEKRLDGETKGLELATRELQAIADGDVPTAAAWRSRWVTRDPQLDQILPPPDALARPDIKQQVLGLGVSTVEFNKAKAKGLEAFINGDYRKGLGNTLAVAPSLEAARATIEEAKSAIPKSAQGDIALFETLLANADGLAAFQAAAGNAALSEKERLELQAKAVDDQRQAATQAETMRHNRVVEGQGAQRVGLEGQRVKIAQQDAGKPRAVTPTAEAAIINRLQTQWSKATASQNAINRQVTIMEQGLAAGRRGDLPQANEAVLQTFLKILDPDSVVREGEFQRLREGASMMTRAEAAIQRLTQGGFLPMSELEKYAQLAKSIQAETKGVVEPIRSRVGKTADRYNIPRDLVMDEIPGAPLTQNAGVAAPANIASLLSSKGPGTYTLSDGSKWRKDASGIRQVK